MKLEKLKNIFSSSEGRLSQGQFAGYILAIYLLLIIVQYILVFIFTFIGICFGLSEFILIIVGTIITLSTDILFAIYGYLPLFYKRAHDIDEDGKNKAKIVLWILILSSVGSSLITLQRVIVFIDPSIINYIIIFLNLGLLFIAKSILFNKGTVGINQFGPDPLVKK